MKDFFSDINRVEHLMTQFVIPFALKIVGAVAVWIIGGMVVRGLQRVLNIALEKRHVDATLVRYANSTAGLILKGLLFLMILNIFGIETTSFSAILAAAGVAIGVAWSGLLSNFAAGVFLIIFRPFRVGDVITAAGVTGVVREIGLFATSIDNGDNLRIFVPNNKLFSDNIANFSVNGHRMLTFKIQIAAHVDSEKTALTLKKKLEEVQGVEKGIPVSAEITEMSPWTTTILLKVGTHQSSAGPVQQEGYRRLHQALREMNLPPPAMSDVRVMPQA